MPPLAYKASATAGVPGSPCGPAGPCGPTAPVAPVAPGSPCGPGAPCGPIGPIGPVAPIGPIGPRRYSMLVHGDELWHGVGRIGQHGLLNQLKNIRIFPLFCYVWCKASNLSLKTSGLLYLEYKTGVKQLVCAFGAMHKFDIFYEFCSLFVWNWFESK